MTNYALLTEHIPIFVFAIALAIIAWRLPLISGILPAVCLTHPLIDHIGLSVKYHEFRPGSFSAIFLMLPLSLWLYDIASNQNFFPISALVISGAIGLGISIWLWWEVEKELKS